MDVKLPKLGEGADSGVVVTIFVKPGDRVTKEQPLLEIENEKAVATIPSPADGVIEKILVKPGDKLNVGQRILVLGAGDGAAPAAGTAPEPEPVTEPEPEPAAAPAPAPEPEAAADEEAAPEKLAHTAAASPSIRRVAKELGIDLAKVRGTERGGRIAMGDLRAYIQRLEKLAAKASATPAKAVKATPERIDFSKWGPVNVKPLSPLRQVISRRMSESWEAVPRVTQFDEADVSRLLALRKQHAAAYEAKGARLTLTGLAVKAVVTTLQKHPLFNSSLDETGANLVIKSYFHIGIAVDTDSGLMVPVIRDADKKSLLEISRELETLAARARDRKIAAEELKGGSFTISNQGAIGSSYFTPVINLPEVAILGMGKGATKPVWIASQFEPRVLVPLGLSYDHRVVDGGSAARFMVDLVQAFEKFDESLLKI